MSSSSESGADFEQLKKRWTALVKHFKDDPRVTRLLSTRLGRYLSSHSFVALTALMFCAMAAVPVGLFVTFAVVTMMISAVGFVVCEGRCAHPCAVAFYDTAPPGSHKPVTYMNAASGGVTSLRKWEVCVRKGILCKICAKSSVDSFCPPSGQGSSSNYVSVSPVFSMKAEVIEAFWTIPPWAVSHLMIQPLRYNCWKWCLLLAKAML
uniref:Transmembrane protein 159 n=1 Tax=Haplochromis burtoni TaxID=8153 RepID=A0A3Q2WT93_HAPBU